MENVTKEHEYMYILRGVVASSFLDNETKCELLNFLHDMERELEFVLISGTNKKDDANG